MALPATGIIEIRSTATASNVNGGGFNSARGGTDYSQQNAAQLALTDLASTSASGWLTLTSATGGFTSVMVGNYVHIASGTNFTAGWYEITAYTNGNTVTVDRACGATADASAGVGKVGGAMSLASILDDDLFEAGVAGNIFYIKGGAGPITYTLGEAVSIAAAGGVSNPIKVIGYATTRGDTPTGTTRPIIACGANVFSGGANWEFYNLIFSGTGLPLLTMGASAKAVNTKCINMSTSASRAAHTMGTNSILYKSECISYRGLGVSKGSGSGFGMFYNYIHDSDRGIDFSAGSAFCAGEVVGNIISDNVSKGVNFLSAGTGHISFLNNTIYGAENKLGVGVNFVTGSTNNTLINNIIYGFVTGVSHADTQSVGFDDYNDYNNNTTDVTNWTKGANDTTTNPAFTSVAQLTGSTATTSGSVLTQSGGDFSTVTDNVDFVYIKSGTGVTVGKYMITSHTATTITLDIAPGTNATADKVWQITTGHNFAITGAI